jgi:putative oxidoreductase
MLKKYQSFSPLLLRLAMGVGFMAHGWAKLSRGTQGFEKLLAQTGVPFAHINSWIVPFVELLGGLALLLGAFIAIVSIPLIMTMLVAMFTVQIHYGFSSIKTIGLTPAGPLFGPPGYEINLLYIAGLLSLLITGAGKYSVDALLRRKGGANFIDRPLPTAKIKKA